MSGQVPNNDPNVAENQEPQSDQVNWDDLMLVEALKAGGSALEGIRKNATDWRTGLAGLLTIVTTALVFKPPEKVSAYPPPFPIILGAAALIAAVAGAAGMWLLLLAAHGSFKEVTKAEVTAKGGYEAWMSDFTTSAANHLRWGRILALLSVALVGGLIAFSWYAPKAPDDPPAFVRVTEAGTGKQYCGSLEVADANGVRVKVKGERDAHNVTIDKLASVVLVDKC